MKHTTKVLSVYRLLILSMTAGLLFGCSWGPVVDAPPQSQRPSKTRVETESSPLVQIASRQLGVPYRYGGSTPQEGFDCSGLVYFAHQQLGIPVPRTSRDQYRAATPVPSGGLRPGDLLFYKIDGKRISHVGIYVGNRRFLHAPKSGGEVSYGNLDDRFWIQRFAGAGHFRH